MVDDVVGEDGAAVAEKQEESPMDTLDAKRAEPEETKPEQEPEEEEDWWQEHEREKRIVKPWLYETGRLLAEPPDINYRRIIVRDDERIEWLLRPGWYHFEERCLRHERHDVELELELLEVYQYWCKDIRKSSKAQQGVCDRRFFDALYDAISEDAEVVQKYVVERKYDERMVQGKVSFAVRGGSGRFFHIHEDCWFYYDEKDRDWHREPEEEGPQYDTRRQGWREEALAGREQRYIYCVQRQFYCYHKEKNQWHEDGPIYRKWYPGFFKYDKEKCQWRPPNWLIEKQEEDEARAASRAAAQEAGEKEANMEAHSLTDGETPSPEPSTLQNHRLPFHKPTLPIKPHTTSSGS